MLVASSVFAQTTASVFLKKMQDVNASTQSINSDFVQTRRLSIMNNPLISSGKFYYKKPGLMKWDQQLPTPYYFIINGNKVIRFDGKERKVMPSNSPQISHFKDFILGTINGSMFTSKKYDAIFKKNNNLITVELVPLQKSMLKRIEKIAMTFDFETAVLRALTITEVGGDKMEVVFTNHQINTIIDNAIFE